MLLGLLCSHKKIHCIGLVDACCLVQHGPIITDADKRGAHVQHTKGEVLNSAFCITCITCMLRVNLEPAYAIQNHAFGRLSGKPCARHICK